jgi:hypothetical protein
MSWSWVSMAGCAWMGASFAAAIFGSKIASLAPPDGTAVVERLVRRRRYSGDDRLR